MITIIEHISMIILDAALEKLKNKVANKNVKDVHKKRIESLLKEIQDEPFYNALDIYLTADGIINKMVSYCDGYIDQKKSAKNFVDEIAINFWEQNRHLSYINLNFLKEFFERIFTEIFKIRFSCDKNSEAETIVAKLKRELENNDISIYTVDMEKKIDKIWQKLCQNDFTSNDKRFQFLEKYNGRLFLEEEDENGIELKDVYVSPRYKVNGSIRDNIHQYIGEFLSDSVEENVLLIIGPPTVGKSSLICDLLCQYIYRNDIIALQLKELDGTMDLVSALKNKLQCNDSDFANKILILDGFDEAKVCKNQNINDINNICREFICDLQGLLPSKAFFKVIMTIRTDFFKQKRQIDYNKMQVIELVEFCKSQIREFQEKYKKKRNISPKISKFITQELNQKKLGIVSNPMMLYMICRYEEDWGHDLKKIDIYDSIFNENGPLFSNLYKGKGRAENIENIEKFYNIISEIAFEMNRRSVFVLSEQDAKRLIPQFDSNIIRFTGMAILSRDNKQINQIEFIHSTICSYFAAKYIYCQISSIYHQEDFQGKEMVLKQIDMLFSHRDVEGEVLEFLQYFIAKGDICEQEKESKILLNATPYILEKNCIYTVESVSDISLLERIHNSFDGYWKIFTIIYLHIYKSGILINKLLPDDKSIWKNLARLLKNGYYNKVYLRGADFSGIDLRCAILKKADISSSNLSNADMRGASLIDVKLCNSTLDNANFNGADMCRANLQGASLRGLKIRGSVLKECKFKNNKNVEGVKFSYSNVAFIQGIKEEELEKCFVYNKSGKMKQYNEYMNEDMNDKI